MRATDSFNIQKAYKMIRPRLRPQFNNEQNKEKYYSKQKRIKD